MTPSPLIPLERVVRARTGQGSLSEPTPISHYQSTRAWVLLGDPGSGKSKTFEALAVTNGHNPISARDFIELEPPVGGYRTPLFIDGLDEYTAGSGDGFTAIGRIRQRLQSLGTPPFRISCREADWRGSTDSEALSRLVGQENFVELHLAPLDAEQVLQFAAHWLQCNKAEAQAFVSEARRRDLDGLLSNPQTLRMLIDAVGGASRNWPKSKHETYIKACAKLVRDHNDAHLDAARDTLLPDTQILRAASYLCAVMLLSGSTAATPTKQNQTSHVVELGALKTGSADTPSLSACRAALHTHLFASDGTGQFTPVHRTVAEYLGAQFLAERIHAHLPAKRVLALIQGEDGGVVPELRGLHAWLAVVVNDNVRRILIDHDPLGLVLNGDVQGFRTQEKIHLLQALQHEAKRYEHFRNQHWASRRFGALATPDMAEHFKTWMQSPDRSPAHQTVLDCVLDAVQHGQPMPALAEDLERIVGDATYWAGMRRSALYALCSFAEKDLHWTAPQRIFESLYQGRTEDTDNDLMGVLLHKLYPNTILAKDLWKYYRRSSPTHLNQHWDFWHNLARHAPREDIPVLLNALLATDIRLHAAAGERHENEMIGALLYEAIVHFAEQTPVERVFEWLSLGVGPYSNNCLPRDIQTKLGHWLSAHPALYRRLVEHGITAYKKLGQPAHRWFYDIYKHMCDAPRPHDAAQWYFQLAETRTDDFRQQLLREAFFLTCHYDSDDAALERMAQWAAQHSQDAKWVQTEVLSCPYPPDAQHLSRIDLDLARAKEESQQNAEELAFLSKSLPHLTGSEANLSLLNHVAETYMDFYHGEEAVAPNERLLKKLDHNPQWVEMALAGLRHCLLGRDDLPSMVDILALNRQNRRYTIATPLLAAMQLRYDERPSNALDMDESLLQLLVAFRLTNNYGNTPEWFSALVQARPETVAAVMRPLMAQQITAKREQVDGLYALAHDPQYNRVAQLVAPHLIEVLPNKASKKQLTVVQELIACLLHTLDRPQQLVLIERQLSKPTMDVAQRVYWFTVGVQIAPEKYLTPLQQYLDHNQTRASHVYALLQSQSEEREGVAHLTLEAKVFFVELLGERFTPALAPKSGKAYRVTSAMYHMRFVQQVISSIASDPSDGAQRALAQLVQKPGLKPWRSPVQHAAYQQQQLRRKVLFKPASVADVCNTLANLRPANAADLHALVLDHLQVMADEIRNDSTDNYDQYWDGNTPKVENACRNVLLSHLKPRLNPLGVSAEQEGTYADQKRADIKVGCGALHFPIEIKRNSNPELWKAIREQLVAKYSRERSSNGYGIYIVFWFGISAKPTAADGGATPKTPQELQERLAATVPPELNNKISVLVIDCARSPTRP